MCIMAAMGKMISFVAVLMVTLIVGEFNFTDGMTFDKDDFQVVMEKDTHGGFNGDGLYYLVLDCSNDKEKAMENVEEWDKFPLPQNLEFVAYGGTVDGHHYSRIFPDEVVIPEIEKGYYYFNDRYYDEDSVPVDPSDSSMLFDRGTLNFDFAIYDADNAMLYYLREDT